MGMFNPFFSYTGIGHVKILQILVQKLANNGQISLLSQELPSIRFNVLDGKAIYSGWKLVQGGQGKIRKLYIQ
ncbi:5204_t:CDS:2, partial [Entrophospora sp. SA101]